MADAAINRYTAADSSEEIQLSNLTVIVAAMKSGAPSPRDLIANMASQLTSEDDRIRTRGCMLFAQVLAKAPELFTAESDVATAADFLSTRLADRVSARPALTGCLALLQRKAASSMPPLSSSSAVTMVRRMEQHIQVQAFGQQERMLAFQALQTAIREYGQQLMEADIDVAEAVAAAAEGERDPRCLLCAFDCIHEAAALCSSLPSQSDTDQSDRISGSNLIEVLFDVLTWYFPVAFTPPPVNKFNITRETLVTALERTCVSTTAFSPYFLPLVLDKLSSDVRQAKLDALSAIAAAAEGYGAEVMRHHLPSIWRALRVHIIQESASDVEADAQASEVTEAALECLRRCVVSIGRELSQMVMADAFIDDMKASMTSATIDSLRRSEARVCAISRGIAATAQASPEALDIVIRHMGDFLLTAAAPRSGDRAEGVQFSTFDPTMPAPPAALRALALTAADDLVRAGLHGVAKDCPIESTPLFKAFASRLMSLMLEDMISEGVKSESEGNHSTDNELDIRHSTDSSPQGSSYVEAAKKLQQAQSAVTTSLVSFPAARSPLESRELETLIGLTLQKLAPNDEEGTSSEQVSAAIQTLRVMGSGGHTQLLRKGAVQPLLDRWRDRSRVPSLHMRVALDTLAALCCCNRDLRPFIISELGESLPDVLRADSAGMAAGTMVLEALSDVIQSVKRPFCGADEAAIVPVTIQLLAFEDGNQLSDKCLTACSNFAGSAASGCHPEAARELWSAACTVLTAAASGFASNNSAQIQSHCRAAAAVVASVPSKEVQLTVTTVDTSGVLSDVVDILLVLALLQGDEASPAAKALAAAAGSVVNKAEGGAQLDQAVEHALDHRLLSHCTANSESTSIMAAVSLGHVTRGLIMRCHKAADRCIRMLVSLTSSSDMAVASVAANALGSALLDQSDLLEQHARGAAASCSAARHCVVKPLWQQKAFIQLSGMQLESLRNCLRTQRPAPLPLLSSLAAAVVAVPSRVLAPDAPSLLPWLLQALTKLQTSVGEGQKGASSQSVVTAVIAVKETALKPTAKAAVAEHCTGLVALLQQTAAFPASASARQAALECLAGLSLVLSSTAAADHRSEILAVSRRALDDNIRSVRQAAIKCRSAWTR